MDRRKFISAAAATTLTVPLVSAESLGSRAQAGKEIYELRTYEMALGGNQAALRSFLKEVEEPFLKNNGANHFMAFNESDQRQPTNLWTLTSFPDFNVFNQVVAHRDQNDYLSQSSAYTKAGKIYNRISSSLLYAFDGLPQMKMPMENANLFELRIYEGLNEDAVRRKIKMFNDEELDLFYKVDLNPVFFGNMMVGPYVPCLVYMLNYRDMAHRDQAWNDFLEHPEWIVMRDKEIYANTVSNIRRVFLELSS